jgi:MFS family permease
LPGIASVIAQGFWSGDHSTIWWRALIGLSLITQAPMFILTYLASEYWMQYPVMVLSTAIAGLLWPTIGALVANSVPPHEQGRLAGVNTSLGSLMNVFGPLCAGALHDNVSHASPFWMWAIFLAIAWLLMFGVRKPRAALEPLSEMGRAAPSSARASVRD